MRAMITISISSDLKIFQIVNPIQKEPTEIQR